MRPEMKQKWVAPTMEQQRVDASGATGGRWRSNEGDASGAAGGAAMSTSELRQQCGGSGRERLHRTAMRAAGKTAARRQSELQWRCEWWQQGRRIISGAAGGGSSRENAEWSCGWSSGGASRAAGGVAAE